MFLNFRKIYNEFRMQFKQSKYDSKLTHDFFRFSFAIFTPKVRIIHENAFFF